MGEFFLSLEPRYEKCYINSDPEDKWYIFPKREGSKLVSPRTKEELVPVSHQDYLKGTEVPKKSKCIGKCKPNKDKTGCASCGQIL